MVLKQSRVDAVFSSLDKNKNGTIEQDDFVLGAKRVAVQSQAAEGSPAHATILAGYQAAWQELSVADTNNNGKITQEEFTTYYNKVFQGVKSFDDFPSYWKAIVDNSFRSIDKNNNNIISKDEYPI